MTKTNKMNFKDLLRNEIKNKLNGNRRCFSREDLRKLIPEGCPSTLNRYLVDFNKEIISWSQEMNFDTKIFTITLITENRKINK